MTVALRLLCLCAIFALGFGDTYFHNPRGSNNRLNERSANRNNANRLFNSQNNNRGGYNAGDMDIGRFSTEDMIYYMKYWQSGAMEGESTYLTLEWTNQHGCGGNEDTDPHKLNCNIVLQYMVIDYDKETVDDSNELTRIRDGTNTNTQNFNTPNDAVTESNYINNRRNQVQANRGMHESYDYYADCSKRERNTNLFTADQRLRDDTAQFTRQNPNGNRNGYECPEERDYYPYWHPTPWRDIAVLTDNTSLCGFYRNESFNVRPRHICRHTFDSGATHPWSPHNNQEDCEGDEDVNKRGVWVEQYSYIDIDSTATTEQMCTSEARRATDRLMRVWASPEYGQAAACLVLPPAPDCAQVNWTRVNHLGNGRDGFPLNYTWRIPHFPSGSRKLAVVRIRYNISTDDYNPWATNSSFNSNRATGRRSPVTQNPSIDISSSQNKPLRLAVNTAQFGRTFQDRSHVVELRPRSDLPAAARSCEILNLNVRGKRGNIVQVYPSVEYDFIPNRLEVTTDQCIHVQWTGSNSHNNGNPAGDGQAGDAGEGTGGTDRSNIVQALGPNVNYPIPWDKNTQNNMFMNSEVLWSSIGSVATLNSDDVAVIAASAGYYECRAQATCGAESVEVKTPMNQLLNNAPASFEGMLLRFTVSGRYYYFCSRNNNFTNRSQKGMISVRAAKK